MPKNIYEKRTFNISEIRTITNDKGLKTITGYAAVFNSLSEDLGGFREKIDREAFTRTIQNADVRALFNHDKNYVLGRTKSGTLKLSSDEHGLKIENIPPDTQWARDLLVSIDRGDVNQMSFGFRTISDKWEKRDKEDIRTLLDVELFDISPVTFPAYPDTEVGLRSLENFKKTIDPLIDSKKDQPNPLISNSQIAQEDEIFKKLKRIGGKK